VNIEFVAGFAAISDDPKKSIGFYRDTLGLPLEKVEGDYFATGVLGGVKHFGVWPLKDAAKSCFGKDTWPEDIPIPTSTIEYELSDPKAVDDAVEEMKSTGCIFIHEARVEPWGQTVARLLSPEGILVGLSYAPWFHDEQ